MIPYHRVFAMYTAIAAAVFCTNGVSYAADRLPFKMFDAHTHFVSDDFERYPLASQSPSGPSPAAPGVAGQAQPGAAPATPPPGGGPGTGLGGGGMASRFQKGNTTTAEKIFGWWDDNGVEGGVGVQYRSAYGTDNTYLLSVADKFPARVIPVVILDALDPKTPDTLRSYARIHGIAGIRLTGPGDNTTWLDSGPALNTWATANDLGLVVVLMTTPPRAPEPGQIILASPTALTHIAQLAEKYPNVNIVLDHMGWPTPEGGPDYGLSAAHLALKAHRNIYYKFTTINLDNQASAKVSSSDFLRHMVDVFGADHIVWGSDIGNSRSTYESMVTRAVDATAKLSATEQRQILRETGRSLFVRGGRGLGMGAAAAPGASPSSATSGPCSLAATGAPGKPGSAPARGPALDVALKLAQNTISVCSKQGYKVGVSVVDSAGVAKVTLMADGTGARAITTVRKACTAMVFQMPTSEIEAKSKTDASLAARVASSPDFVAHTGALPLRVGDEVIGGIGVSGAPTHEVDEDCARKAIEMLQPDELR